MPSKNRYRKKSTNSVGKLVLLTTFLVLAFTCIFVMFERERTEEVLSRAKRMRVEITADEAMIDSFGDKMEQLLDDASDTVKGWKEDLIGGADNDDVSARLQAVDVRAVKKANNELRLPEGI